MASPCILNKSIVCIDTTNVKIISQTYLLFLFIWQMKYSFFIKIGYIVFIRVLVEFFYPTVAETTEPFLTCNDLLIGQYKCSKPIIDNKTQEAVGCTKDGTAKVPCYPLSGIKCNEKTFDGETIGFEKKIPCRYTNSYSYVVAVALSLFLGWLGVDRFYLGYPALGLLKLCTFGICGIGALVDFMLIALQVVLPADGSNYVVDYYGPRLIHLSLNNDTYYKGT